MLRANTATRKQHHAFNVVTAFRTKTRAASKTAPFLQRHVTNQAINSVEDAQDIAMINERRDEPTIPWEDVKRELGL